MKEKNCEIAQFFQMRTLALLPGMQAILGMGAVSISSVPEFALDT